MRVTDRNTATHSQLWKTPTEELFVVPKQHASAGLWRSILGTAEGWSISSWSFKLRAEASSRTASHEWRAKAEQWRWEIGAFLLRKYVVEGNGRATFAEISGWRAIIVQHYLRLLPVANTFSMRFHQRQSTSWDNQKSRTAASSDCFKIMRIPTKKVPRPGRTST